MSDALPFSARGTSAPATDHPSTQLGLFALVVRTPVLSVGAVLSGMFLVAAIGSLTVSWPLTFPEGAQVAALMRVRDGQPLYQDWRQYPFIITTYAPMMFWVDGAISRLAGLSAYDSLVMARTLTLAFSLGCVPLIYLIARTLQVGRASAIAGALLFLPLPFLDQWGFTARPDVSAVTCGLLTIWIVLRGPRWVSLAAVVAVVGLFTKQTLLALPVAVTLWLLLSQRWLDAARFIGIWAGLSGAGVLAMHQATNGNHLLNVVVANMNPTNSLTDAFSRFVHLPRDGWLPFGLACGGAVLAIRDQRSRLVLLYWLVSAIVTLVTLRNPGRDVNYLIEAGALSCVLAALALHWIWREAITSPIWSAASLAAGALAVLWGVSTAGYWRESGGTNGDRKLPIEQVAQAERPLVEEPTMTILAGRPLVFSDPFQFSQLTSGGRFDPEDMVDRLKRREFDLVVLRGDARRPRALNGQAKWPESIRKAIADYYEPSGRVDLWWLYKPSR